MEVDGVIEADHFDRTLDEVRLVIGHAKLEESDLKPVSQVVSFQNNLFDGSEMKMLQVSKEIAASLSAGDTLTLRGEEDEGVVLCTQNKTYDFKEAETSNSLLILPDLSLDERVGENGERSLEWRTVSGVYFKYFEITEMRPRLHKLRDVVVTLEEEMVKAGTELGHTRTHLLNIIQASESELSEGLKELETITFKNKYFVLERNYQLRALTHILRFFDDNSWPMDSVKKQETMEELKDLVDEDILEQVFLLYCRPADNDDEDSFAVDQDKVCRFFGNYLLTPGSNFTADDFLDMWQKAVPEGLTTNLDQLKGLMLLDTTSTPNKISRFAECDLPNNIHERLQVLFRTRDKWSVPDVTPFIEPLTTPKLNVNALLTKLARPVNINGQKFFCAKHGK